MKLEAAIRGRLGSLPTDLRKSYHETLQQKLESYGEVEKSTTEGALRLLLCLQTKLATKDFIVALSSSTKEHIEICAENILDLCSGFVVIDDELDIFRFTHLSVREFLESQETYGLERSHAFAAQCCFRYLSRSTLLEKISILNDREEVFLEYFHEYASFHWPIHLRESSDYRLSLPLRATTQEFLFGDQKRASPAFSRWNDILWHNLLYCRWKWPSQHDRKFFDGISLPADCILMTSAWEFWDLLELRIKRDSTTLNDRLGIDGETALNIACMFRNLRAAQMLIDSGAEMDIPNKYGETPLHRAAKSAHVEILQLLLDRGANPEIRSPEDVTPL